MDERKLSKVPPRHNRLTDSDTLTQIRFCQFVVLADVKLDPSNFIPSEHALQHFHKPPLYLEGHLCHWIMSKRG
jgi:hypothetical protein